MLGRCLKVVIAREDAESNRPEDEEDLEISD